MINTEISQQGTSYSSYGGTAGTLAINVYSGAANLYKYFRIVITTIFNSAGGGVAELSEWNINFTTPSTSSCTLSLDRLTQNQLNVVGSIKQLWNSGDIIQKKIYCGSSTAIPNNSAGSVKFAIATGTQVEVTESLTTAIPTGGIIIKYEFLPKSTNSFIEVNFDCDYAIDGIATDSLMSKISFEVPNDNLTVFKAVKFVNESHNISIVGRNNGINLFPIMGIKKNTSTNANNIYISLNKSGNIFTDDKVAISKYFLTITEIQAD
jgi:hypothetical protein